MLGWAIAATVVNTVAEQESKDQQFKKDHPTANIVCTVIAFVVVAIIIVAVMTMSVG
jgi:hypothetical protein